jgi:REP element-mobilizing transposase RayT
MARANRHYIPGYLWHITHRCHKKEFLLKFVRDRKRWVNWLFEAKKRYGLSVFNYMVTSNHIHLLVYDNTGRDAIPKSIQLIAARTGQEYNLRKQRKGAFWEDRYHATAIEKNTHLERCLVYIDLNMVRAGVVDYPQMWPFCGYNEIQNPPKRHRIIDIDRLTKLLGFTNLHDFQSAHKRWVEASLIGGKSKRESEWTDSIAVGGRSFVEKVKENLGFRAKGRTITGYKDRYQLREKVSDFDNASIHESESDSERHVALRNGLFWNDKS